jgi:hypothetical protein
VRPAAPSFFLSASLLLALSSAAQFAAAGCTPFGHALPPHAAGQHQPACGGGPAISSLRPPCCRAAALQPRFVLPPRLCMINRSMCISCSLAVYSLSGVLVLGAGSLASGSRSASCLKPSTPWRAAAAVARATAPQAATPLQTQTTSAAATAALVGGRADGWQARCAWQR